MAIFELLKTCCTPFMVRLSWNVTNRKTVWRDKTTNRSLEGIIRTVETWEYNFGIMAILRVVGKLQHSFPLSEKQWGCHQQMTFYRNNSTRAMDIGF
jgi:hypothetical protein